jgi:hypothetical protein
MFFFIAGIQPKKVNLEDQPRLCPKCGLYGARLKRLDQYFSVFFLPLFPVKKGTPFLECQRCGIVSQEFQEAWRKPKERPRTRCASCGETLDPDHRFCPYCGRPV